MANGRYPGLVEVDLETLSVVSHETFPFSITALSEAKSSIPLTVGTDRSLYLHDPRARRASRPAGSNSDRLDSYDALFDVVDRSKNSDIRTLLNPEPNPLYTHLSHSKPLSILHLPTSGSEWDGNGEIYVAGRFSSILNYDRRYFPKLKGTIHSGARLASMACLPYPFASMEKDLARRGELSTEQVWVRHPYSLDSFAVINSTAFHSSADGSNHRNSRTVLAKRSLLAASIIAKVLSRCMDCHQLPTPQPRLVLLLATFTTPL